MNFEFYVLNYDCHTKKIVNFNIFNNILVQEWSEKAIRKYLRSPKNYKYVRSLSDNPIFGFDGLVAEIDSIIRWQEWGRREYEISVSDAFCDNLEELEKWDCYAQAKPNMRIITNEIIRQYKEQLKGEKNND